MKFPILLPLLALAILIEVVGVKAVRYAPPQDGQYAACDTADKPDTKTRAHRCECARAKQECKPNEPRPDQEMEPGSMCKAGYCHPERCECESPTCS
jgi:hypothetical protein